MNRMSDVITENIENTYLQIGMIFVMSDATRLGRSAKSPITDAGPRMLPPAEKELEAPFKEEKGTILTVSPKPKVHPLIPCHSYRCPRTAPPRRQIPITPRIPRTMIINPAPSRLITRRKLRALRFPNHHGTQFQQMFHRWSRAFRFVIRLLIGTKLRSSFHAFEIDDVFYGEAETVKWF